MAALAGRWIPLALVRIFASTFATHNCHSLIICIARHTCCRVGHFSPTVDVSLYSTICIPHTIYILSEPRRSALSTNSYVQVALRLGTLPGHSHCSGGE